MLEFARGWIDAIGGEFVGVLASDEEEVAVLSIQKERGACSVGKVPMGVSLPVLG